MNKLSLDTTPGKAQALEKAHGRRPVHVFDRESVLAVNTAIACGRPLLVRGEPGTGKSQLAMATALALGGVPKSRVVDARTEPHELMWRFDAIGRLADAQAARSLPVPAAGEQAAEGQAAQAASEQLDRRRYIHPGPLWWAFDWESAKKQAACAKGVDATPPPEGTHPDEGVVLLIDEIDKADMAVPNALLECLGAGQFEVPGYGYVHKKAPEPLVIFTTNTERVLPSAFVRRCVVLHMRVPELREELVQWLMQRAEKHFDMEAGLLREVAEKVADDRLRAKQGRIPCPPGLAEYIDLLAALDHDPDLDLQEIGRFVLDKHRDPGAPDHDK